MSFLLEIDSEKSKEETEIFSGQKNNNLPALCKCPNCQLMMFPVFVIHRNLLPDLHPESYDDAGFVTLDVCPSCSHSLNNYYVKRENKERVAYLGFQNNEGPSQYVDQTFENRHVKLNAIDELMWTDTEFISKYERRNLSEGILHQLGGKKMKEERTPLAECLSCKSSIDFIATIDYDDLHVPIYEAGVPIALVIGDLNSLNVFTCKKCSALNYGITN